jgi:hypothetical protein
MAGSESAVLGRGVRLGADRYRLEHLLGHGGMASVWLAHDEVLRRSVAVKVLSDSIASDPQYLARFQREARVAARLNHPNLVNVFDFSATGERPYLVMEYVEGGNLADRLAAGMSVKRGRIARELLAALAYIHAVGVLHRDVKPQNVLIGEDGRARLTDFGIAQPEDATSLTQTGEVLGTARYIAPEVMNGERASERSDLYSLGVLLRECPIDDHAPKLERLIGRLTAADASLRPASAAAALARIEGRRAPPAADTARAPVVAETAPTEAQPGKLAEAPSAPAEGPMRLRRRGFELNHSNAVVALLTGAAVLAVATVILIGGGGGDGGSEFAARSDKQGATAEKPADKGAPDAGTAPAASESELAGAALGTALNDQGYALIQEGEYERAISILRRAVDAFPAGTSDLSYAYALFNLGHALRLAGQPQEAIPILEQRLQIPNQTGVVRRELELARAAAGEGEEEHGNRGPGGGGEKGKGNSGPGGGEGKN